jgi:hypothetical protein
MQAKNNDLIKVCGGERTIRCVGKKLIPEKNFLAL